MRCLLPSGGSGASAGLLGLLVWRDCNALCLAIANSSLPFILAVQPRPQTAYYRSFLSTTTNCFTAGVTEQEGKPQHLSGRLGRPDKEYPGNECLLVRPEQPETRSHIASSPARPLHCVPHVPSPGPHAYSEVQVVSPGADDFVLSRAVAQLVLVDVITPRCVSVLVEGYGVPCNACVGGLC